MRKVDIVFIDGFNRDSKSTYGSYLNYLFPCAAVLEAHGFTFKIINVNFMNKNNVENLAEAIEKVGSHIVGMTANASNIYLVSKVTKLLKERNKDIKVLLGGPQATFDDSGTIENTGCDVVIRHDGEYKLVRLLNYFLHNKGALDNIEGITYRDVDGKIKRVATEEQWLDIDSLPTPQYAIIKDPKYWILPDNITKTQQDKFFKEISGENNFFMASRGCPYNCSFCVEGILKKSYRERSVNKVAQDLEYFLDVFNTSIVVLADSTFTASTRRVEEICAVFREINKKRRVSWFAEGRVNILSQNLHLLSMMKEAGLVNLQIGIETGSDEVMSCINKNITKDQIRIVAEEVGRIGGMLLVGNIILGLPNESQSTYDETVAFVKELHDLSRYNMLITSSYFVPFVGTPISNDLKKNNLKLIVKNFEYEQVVGFDSPICLPNDIPEEDFIELKKNFDRTVNTHVKTKILASPKREVDRNMEFVMHLVHSRINMANNWYNAIFKNILFQKFYSLQTRSDTFMEYDSIKNEAKNIFPLRLWDIDYDKDSGEYKFTTLQGEKINIAGLHKICWEYASGKISIHEIATVLSYTKPETYQTVLNEITEFYLKMNDSYAMLFKTIPKYSE